VIKGFDFAVFDLDGTLSDHNHRLHLVTGENKDYDQYYDLCDQDAPHWPVINILKTLVLSGHRVEIWTGRTDRVKEKTLQWLYDVNIDRNLLTFMRKEGDFTPDFQLKGKWLDIRPFKPTMVFEDRPRMVEFWRSQGIFCFDVGGQ
jgi:hypothetical protein